MFSLCCSVCDYACMEEADMKNHISTGHAGTDRVPGVWMIDSRTTCESQRSVCLQKLSLDFRVVFRLVFLFSCIKLFHFFASSKQEAVFLIYFLFYFFNILPLKKKKKSIPIYKPAKTEMRSHCCEDETVTWHLFLKQHYLIFFFYSFLIFFLISQGDLLP